MKQQQQQQLSLHVRRGEPFSVALPSNATTGYAWRVTRTAAPLTQRRYVPDEPVRLGSGGREEFTWSGVDKRGAHNIELCYERAVDGHIARICEVVVSAS